MDRPAIILVGAGGHCRSCIDVIEMEGRFRIAGIVDKATGPIPDLMGYPLLGSDDDLPKLRRRFEYALIAVGQIESCKIRFKLRRLLENMGFQLPTILSPLAHVSAHSEIGKGTIVMHGVIVNAGAKVGSHCILNSQSLIEHDAEIGDYVHVSTGAIINGESSIGDNSFVGSGAVVIHGISLPDHSFVRAGSLVVSENDFRTLEHD